MSARAQGRDPRWEAIQRIVASRSFSRAARLSSFLTYVADRALAGRPEEVTEQQVGMRVFGRPAGYNPSEDNIVRSTARQLRERLALYYQEEGSNDEVRVVLPRGGYLPHFENMASAIAVEAETSALPMQTLGGRRWEWLRLAGAAAAGALLLIAFPHPLAESRTSPLWRLIFDGKRSTILVPGDSGTVMFQNLRGAPVHVAEYASGTFRSTPATLLKADPSVIEDVGTRRYTSFADLKFASKLSSTPGFQPDKFDIRFARDFNVDGLKRSNVVLVGAPQGNPWVELFDNNLNFRIVSDEVSRALTVLNRAPQTGESEKYAYSAYDPSHRAYALITFTRNLDKSGVALLVEGTTVAGIEAATEFLFNDTTMGPILKEATGPNGRLNGFEILLETTNVASSGASAVVKAKRFHSD